MQILDDFAAVSRGIFANWPEGFGEVSCRKLWAPHVTTAVILAFVHMSYHTL